MQECTQQGNFHWKLGRPAPFAKSYMVGRENKGTNNRIMPSTLENNAAAGYQGPVKREQRLLKGAGRLPKLTYVMLKATDKETF